MDGAQRARGTASRPPPGRRAGELTMRRRAAIMTVVAASLALAGCGSDLGMPTPVTSEGDHAVGLWRIFVFIALVIGAIVYGLIGYVVIRSRPRRNDARQPSRRQYNVALEMTYTAI